MRKKNATMKMSSSSLQRCRRRRLQRCRRRHAGSLMRLLAAAPPGRRRPPASSRACHRLMLQLHEEGLVLPEVEPRCLLRLRPSLGGVHLDELHRLVPDVGALDLRGELLALPAGGGRRAGVRGGVGRWEERANDGDTGQRSEAPRVCMARCGGGPRARLFDDIVASIFFLRWA